VIGVVQGYLWMNLAPWERSLTASMPFWHLRTLTGVPVITGLFLFAYNMWMTARGRATAPAGEIPGAVPAAP
jgi:cytochrome c oxidase cbb3-type subunit 1